MRLRLTNGISDYTQHWLSEGGKASSSTFLLMGFPKNIKATPPFTFQTHKRKNGDFSLPEQVIWNCGRTGGNPDGMYNKNGPLFLLFQSDNGIMVSSHRQKVCNQAGG